MQLILHQRFCHGVKSHLYDLHWSQGQLAREMGVTPQYVSQYLSGRNSPGLDVIERFAAAIGVDAVDLLQPLPTEKPRKKMQPV